MEFKLARFEVKEILSPITTDSDYVGWGLKAIHVEEAWKKTKGKGIKIAILDTGVNANHPDLAGNIKEVADFTGSKSGAEDVQGHGSHCAGIIAGVENQFGIIGVAPEAELYCGKVLGDNGSGSYDSIAKGIEWAIKKEVDIISMSLGSSTKPPELLHKLIRQAYDKNILIIAATGNENSEICYPALYDEVIAVSAVDKSLQHAQFSNHGMKNEITAPGVDIVSTYKNGGYAKLSGTSMATPMVAGAAALIIARYRDLFNGSTPEIKSAYEILDRMTTDLGEEGRDEWYGEGIINLALLP
ncbi:S8 family peptidase [Bacillus velezensis]|uniref:S8 family peptidase n=1 Tax=Bacillus velezensis TaxID=492670 RepID=UPI001E34D57D|nr:S8 family peptidase [Bacillus velezensis]MCD7910908.1 S8 family peptidase [Bacillus velezensis]